MDHNSVTGSDMDLISKLFQYTTPGEIPLGFMLGERYIKGIPQEFDPQESRQIIDSNIFCTVITGRNAEGLELRAEYREYRDFPVTEWVAYITNRGDAVTPVLSDIRAVDGVLEGTEAVLVHGNGDTCRPDGYEFVRDIVSEKIKLAPADGTPCNGAFPYMRLLFKEYGVNIAIGWPAQWEACFAPFESEAIRGVSFYAKQQRTVMYLNPGETIRTPRITLMGFTGSESRARNLWRRWYFKHIIPKENGKSIPPKLCLHTWLIDGKQEFTGCTEENQLYAISEYIRKGFDPDIWWIDAGWYPCEGNWTIVGNWWLNPENFPNGLMPVSKKCKENGIQFLLWFEPERVVRGTWLDREFPSWILSCKDGNGEPTGYMLLNLGNRSCCDWLIEYVDKFIKDNGVHIYRQDFNIAPLPVWIENESEGRIGMLENQHVQGYLRYWDELIKRNPGLWIDSCASGGRRNDLETMRRAVPLHYTDVGYGNHPIKQKQHRAMFEWIPYFRAHTMSWDNEKGEYIEWSKRAVDRFAYHCAMAPSITSMIEFYDGDELFEVGRKMHPIWRRAAELMESGDYYPLSECRKSEEDYYAMQFDDPERCCGFIQAVRNTRAREDSFTVTPFVVKEAEYTFENPESGERFKISGEKLAQGFTVNIPIRSGAIWFYKFSLNDDRAPV